ncbi:MAG: molybdopterin-dependent oxidoreductase, partial [Proteobacteria bacterium]|nr:molybdopterin-dependent oxidoreductase [Pseudomonadota bacterium]
KDGAISGWQHSIVGQSVMAASIFGAAIEKTGIDSTSIEGVDGSPYDLKDFHLQLQLPKSEVTTLWWRSVGHTHTAYVMETFIDQLAEAAKVDALSFRQKLLKKSPRHLAVLNLLAKKSPWGKTPEKAHAYGLAIHESFKTVVAHLVDVSLLDNKVQIHKVYSAVHCGMVVNPAGARSQIEGAIVYGLTAALYGQITLDRGQVEQSNFHDYPVLRFNQMPATEVYFVESQDAPTGLGEPGLPPIAPAIANAIYKLSAKRIRTLPISQSLEIKA